MKKVRKVKRVKKVRKVKSAQKIKQGKKAQGRSGPLILQLKNAKMLKYRWFCKQKRRGDKPGRSHAAPPAAPPISTFKGPSNLPYKDLIRTLPPSEEVGPNL